MPVTAAIPLDTLSRQERLTVARIIKVNHAGEYGAIRIYRAQLAIARLWMTDLTTFLGETLSHEETHCRRFREAMDERGTRPCYAMWLWGIGGGVLGLVTALMGRNAVMACTKAVEQTVYSHLEDQLHWLARRDEALRTTIAAIQVEEDAHLAHACAHLAPSPLNHLIEAFVVVATEIVIWLSTQGAASRMAATLAR